MAGKTNNEPLPDFFHQLDVARSEVRSKFSRFYKLLQERECTLLRQLQEIENSYKQRHMKEIKQKNELLATKVNLQTYPDLYENMDSLKKSLIPVEANLKVLEKGVSEIVTVTWDEERMMDLLKLKEIGTIKHTLLDNFTRTTKPSKINYETKLYPVLVACKFKRDAFRGNSVFKSPTAVAIHPLTKNIYVIDALNNRVQVFDSSCNFLFTITQSMDYPAGICFHDSRMYVTQFTGNVITVYTEEGGLVQSIGSLGDSMLQFKSPLGICYSSYNDAFYVCERDNDIVQVLNSDMSFNSFIPGLVKPVDVKAMRKELFVLDRQNPCFHVFNYEHQLIREIISLGDEGCQVCKPVHFCLDTLSNILLTDYTTCRVIIFSKEGKQIYKFGKEGKRPGCFIEPRGIALDSEGRIIVASQNPDHCIQFF